MGLTKSSRMISMIGLTFVFLLVEIITGYVTNSMALVTDSFHMISDFVALVVGLVCVRISKWPSKRNTFGWIRAEVLGAMVNAVFLLALCFSIFVEALKRLSQVQEVNNPELLMVVGACGLLINVIGMMLFHQHGHSHLHSHLHSHDHSVSGGGHIEDIRSLGDRVPSHGDAHDAHDTADGRQSDTMINIEDGDDISLEKGSQKLESEGHLNMRGVFLHVLGDALGSVIVIISALVIWLVEDDWRYYVDPALSLILVGIILFSTIPLFKESSFILLQSVPSHIQTDRIRGKLEKLQGIRAVHDLHIWQLAGSHIVASVHVRCDSIHKYTVLASEMKQLFHNEGIESTTIEQEFSEAYICSPGGITVIDVSQL
ncbi:zinc/cadmium resistance protein-like [Gigantopelta aegis]|uniref:zinc/cadmium resistance protein-like n=1 Tax=Gigantopelta aegis TaxID=1735272 RepID=UPI001B88B867|nr:zinc/cadmium resistance protein-like [Gigantopelta aegis]